MAHDAEYGCADGEPDSLFGDSEPPQPPPGPAGRLRWVCGASAGVPPRSVDGASGRRAADPVDAVDRAVDARDRAVDAVDQTVDAAGAGHAAVPGHAVGASYSAGSDHVSATAGSDHVSATAGSDHVSATAGSDHASAADGSDRASAPDGLRRAEPRPGRIPRPRPGEPDIANEPEPGSVPAGSNGVLTRPEGASAGWVGSSAGREGASAGSEGSSAEPDETPAGPEGPRSPSCRTDRPGWAGAHRHGAVRPTRRATRRDRPPRRWC